MKAPHYFAYHLLPLMFHASALTNAVAKSQQRLQMPSTGITTGRERLIGGNDAHFCGVPEEEQLFKIAEFDVSPRPPVVDTRLFAFLSGGIRGVSEEDLADATLRITTTSSDDNGPWVVNEKLSEYPNIVVRKEGEYSGYLKPGENDMIGDIVLYSWWTPTAAYHFEVEAKLPDGRTLFCFDFEYFIEGDRS